MGLNLLMNQQSVELDQCQWTVSVESDTGRKTITGIMTLKSECELDTKTAYSSWLVIGHSEKNNRYVSTKIINPTIVQAENKEGKTVFSFEALSIGPWKGIE